MNKIRLTTRQRELLRYIRSPYEFVGTDSPDDFPAIDQLVRRGVATIAEDLRDSDVPFVIARVASREHFNQLVAQEAITPQQKSTRNGVL